MDICMKMKLAVSLLYFLQACIGIQGEYIYRYLGCYKDKPSDRALSEDWYKKNNKNTREYCLDYCSQGDYKYAGLEYGKECWCGNSGYDKYGRGGGCTYECTGNENQICGGSKRLSVYAITYLPEPITTTTASPTTSVPVPATSPTTTASASSLSVPMESETTSSTTTATTAISFTTAMEAETYTSPTNTVSVSSFLVTTEFENTSTPTSTMITTNTSILPNTSTLLANNSMVTADRRADGNTLSSNPREKGNSTTYIGIGVGAAVGCAIIVLIVLLVVRRRRNSRENKETVQHKDFDNLAYSSHTIDPEPDSMELPGEPRYESVIFSSDETTPSVVPTPSNDNQSADNNSGNDPVYSLAEPIIDDLVVVENPIYG